MAEEEKKVQDPATDPATPETNAPAQAPADNAEEKKATPNEAGNDLEELTYKERYANSTKEAQRIMEENKKLREKLGLKENDQLEEGSEEKKESPAEETDKEEETTDEEDKKEPVAPKEEVEPPRVFDSPEKQTSFELSWDSVAAEFPRLNRKEVADKVATEIKRFSVDTEGKPVSYKKAISDALRFVDGPEMAKSAIVKARDEGMIAATKTKTTLPEGSTKGAPASTGKELTAEQQKVARNLGMTDEDYLANIPK